MAVRAGDTVKKGQALAVMDAMKMEHTIAPPQDGVVSELLYAPGDQVVEGAELLRLGAWRNGVGFAERGAEGTAFRAALSMAGNDLLVSRMSRRQSAWFVGIFIPV